MSNQYGQYGYGQQPPYGQMPYGQQMPQMPMPTQYGQGYYQTPPQGYYPPPPQAAQQKPSEQKLDQSKINISNGKPSKIEFNDEPKYQDLWAGILHICTLVVTGAIAFVSIKHMDVNNLTKERQPKKTNKYHHNNNYNNNYGYNNNYKRETKQDLSSFDIYTMLGSALVGATVLTMFYMFLIQKFAGKMIKGTLILSIIFNIVLAVLSFLANPLIGIIMLIFAIIYAACYFFWRSRIPFAKVMLKAVVSVTKKFPATIFAGFVGLVAAFIWYGLIATTVIAALSYWQDENPKIAYIIYVYLLFSFFFTSQVINNTIHVTIAGVFATYYFRGVNEPGTNNIEVDVKNPTLQSFKRATTTSYGSVCFGSLLIAVVSTLRVLANNIKRDSADEGDYIMCVLACCLECILSCLEDGIEYFNVYAFTEVAIYGKPYCQAAKDTWTLCKARGIEALINDNLIGNVLSIGALCVGCLSCVITCLYGVIILGIKSGAIVAVFGVVAFLVGMMMFSVVAQVINSGVATTFVCLCEDPDALRQTKPELWEKVRDTYPSIVY